MIKWTADLAYAIGLITTDGSLSKDKRHINLTSKDLDQIKTFAKILGLKNKIGKKKSSYSPRKECFQIQFGNVELYHFLEKIGLEPNKTKTLSSLKIPNIYFGDFLRGHLDGDGCTYSYWDPRWKSSFMFYTVFICASKKHLEWLKERIKNLYKIEGRISTHKTWFNLRFAKYDSLKLLNKIYYRNNLPYLKRKKCKIDDALSIINKRAEVLELVDRLA